jgi:uncharacterized protein
MLASLVRAAALAAGLLISLPAVAATPQAEASFRAGQQAALRSDEVTARREYERACEVGHLRACTLLATRVADGVGGPADPRRARLLLAKACVVNMSWSELSEAEACLMLGDMYAEGEGGPAQPARAAYLYSRACDIGDGEACEALGDMMLAEDLLPLNADPMLLTIAGRACFTEDRDYCMALYLSGGVDFELAQGYGYAPQRFREAHRLPAGAPPSRKKDLLTEACEGGMARACARAAWEWKHGFRNMPVDPRQALQLYTQACLLGDGAGCDELGDALRTGSAIPKDLTGAAEAYGLACMVAYPPGCRSLAGMHRRGEVTADLPRARALERFVCDAGWGCVTYADMLLKGVGGPADPARARQVLRAECDDENFSSNACDILARIG